MTSAPFRVNRPKLAELRFRAGFTQSGLARKAGLNRNYVHRIEIGKFEPTPANLLRIAAALGVELDAITDRAAA